VGADADLAIFDPTDKRTLRHDMLHDNSDYTPFEGTPCIGWPVMTISRGAIVACNGEFTGKAGHGRFMKRKPFSAS